MRATAIDKARAAHRVGVILGTLGRQGSPQVVESVESLLVKKGIDHFVVLLSEIFPSKLSLFSDVDAYESPTFTLFFLFLSFQLGAGCVSALIDRLGLCI